MSRLFLLLVLTSITGCSANSKPLLVSAGPVPHDSSIPQLSVNDFHRAYVSTCQGWFDKSELAEAGWEDNIQLRNSLSIDMARRFKWDDRTISSVWNRTVFVGMPREAVRWSSGDPSSITKHESSTGTQEFWHYYRCTYYLVDDKLESVTQYR